MKIKFIALFLPLLLFPQIIAMAADNTTIDPIDRADMINKIDAFVSENLRAQKETFSITLKGKFISSYSVNDDDYFNTDISLKNFFGESGNDYYATIFNSNSQDPISLNFQSDLKTTWITLTYTISWKESYEQTQAVKNYVKTINSGILNSSMSQYQKAKAIHDYLIDKYDYDMSFSDNPPYHLISNSKYTCNNFTALYYLALKDAGIDSRIILLNSNNQPAMAEASKNNWATHAWNMALIDGKWYHIDLTWDENVPKEKYRYFLKSSNTFKADHRWDTSLYPTASADYAQTTVPLPSSSKAAPQSSSNATVSSSTVPDSVSSDILISSSESSLIFSSISNISSTAPAQKGNNSTVVIVAVSSVFVISFAGVGLYLFKFKAR